MDGKQRGGNQDVKDKERKGGKDEAGVKESGEGGGSIPTYRKTISNDMQYSAVLSKVYRVTMATELRSHYSKEDHENIMIK